MRLISAEITGLGRLVDTKINLDRKLIAVVGPNEAGKTTLLNALESISSGRDLPLTMRSRAREVGNDDNVVSVTFELDDSDKASIAEYGVSSIPSRFSVHRHAGETGVYVKMSPYPGRDFSPLAKLLDSFTKTTKSMSVSVEKSSKKLDVDQEELAGLIERNMNEEKVLRTLVSRQQEANDHQIAKIEELRRDWNDLLPETSIESLIDNIHEWMQARPDIDSIRNVLWKRCPDFLLFDDDSRTIDSSYTLTEQLVATPPSSLKNLSDLADLDLGELWKAYAQGLQAKRDTLLLQANNRLREEFGIAWNQSNLAVHFHIDAAVLSVQIIENGAEVYVFSERSSGLRMFVALWAFIRSKNLRVKPVLLIDEAELHLHLDAQADLIQMLMTQDKVSNVIYTTHSPGCLPPDLGTGVRVIKPSKDNPNLSTISNSFWTSAVGFSPLMMAMGASASAFSTVRYAVLAEGASEMLLLPSLLREANGIDHIVYQVAPGLSEAPKRLYPELDLLAARVACVVDGDDGGKELEKQLIKSGFPKALILPLGATTLENLLDPKRYFDVVSDLIREVNPDKPIPPLPDLSSHDEPWSNILADWARPLRLNVPSKTAIASRLVESGNAVPSPKGRRRLKSLHRRLNEVFGL